MSNDERTDGPQVASRQIDRLILATEQKAHAEAMRAEIERQRLEAEQEMFLCLQGIERKIDALLEIQRIIIPRVMSSGEAEAQRLADLLRVIGGGPRVNTDVLVGTRLNSGRDVNVDGDVVGRDKT
jgi:hypothetical protein